MEVLRSTISPKTVKAVVRRRNHPGGALIDRCATMSAVAADQSPAGARPAATATSLTYGFRASAYGVVFFLLFAVTPVFLVPAASLGAEASGNADTRATLHISGGDYLAGELSDCNQAGVLRWQGAAFAAPFDFPLGAVSAVRFPKVIKRPRASGQYCFELEGGDTLFGILTELSAQETQLEVPGLGLLQVKRWALRRILHWDGSDFIYVGPNGLSEWKEASPGGAWEQEGGQLLTARDGASLAGDFGVPVKACVEFELSWTSEPDFVFAMGANGGQDDQAFRLEVCDRQLVLLRETSEKADVASLQKVNSGAGRCHFQVYLDQQAGRATAVGMDGKILANLAVSKGHGPAGSGLRLTNHRGNVRLERLRISRWNGQPPQEVQADKSRFHRSDGSIEYGEIRKFDASAKEFIIAQDGKDRRIRADAIESIVLSPSGSSPSASPPSGNPPSGSPFSGDAPPCDVRLIFQDGSRLSGQLRKVEKGRIWLSRPGLADPLAVLASDLQSIVVCTERRGPSGTAGRGGRLEGEGLRLDGCLTQGREQAGASCLVWHPHVSTTASPLKPDIAARIVYRDRPPPSSPQPSAQPHVVVQVAPRPAPPARADGLLGRLANALADERSPTTPPPSQTRSSVPALYLRTGDTIPCSVKRIDGKGVAIASSVFGEKLIAHDKVKAVDLENSSIATKIDAAKRDRLLTLPRAQRDDPPTHLIRSVDGDYLRGRLVEMDDKTVTVEVRLETRRLPREQIARIIWLADSSEPSRPRMTGASPPPGTRVQTLREDGIRLTFFAESMAEMALRGTSELLGACRVELGSLDQLTIGAAIEQSATDLPYQRWKLQRATEPKVAISDGNQGSRVQGVESSLVGKPAPDFELETLDSGRFRLSEHRGKVVVLDFWATWCGPCVQTVPQIVRAVGKYHDRGVVLLAVNLQETPQAIRAMLTRLDLKTTVALDHNGAVAEKYAAVAIPQTVIIDGKGNIARLFVGGGPQYVDQVRSAIEATLKPKTGQKTAP